MFIGVCYHNEGWGLLKCLVDSLERCGCQHNKFVWLNTHGDSKTHKDYILEKLPNSEFLSIDVPQEKMIPVNRAWKFLAELAQTRREDFFFCDNDVVFFAPNVFDVLYDEFLQKNCRVCGTLLHDPQGVYDLYPPGIKERAGGLHTVGVAFYDRDVIDIAVSIHGCPDGIPYDVWCKEHFLANFSASYYAAHRLKTELEDIDFLFPSQFFHHGCKDASLWDLVRERDHWAEMPEVIFPEVGP